MLKFFKNLFGSGQAEGNANGNGYATPYAPAQNQTDVAEAEPAIEAQPTHYAAAPSAPAQAAYASNTGVRVSLQAIIAVLPLELRTRVQQTAVSGVFVTLPVGRVVSQLAAGAVRMTFGELRAACPNAFSPQADRDTLQIALPLNEILPQINPALLPRRQAQRQVQVPEEVTGPFGNDGFGVTFAETRTITGTPVAGAPEPLPEPTPVAPPPPPPAPVAPRAVQPPKPVPFTPPPRSVQPQPPKPAAPAPAPTFTPKPAPMVPKPAPAAPQPIAMKPPQAPIAPKPAPMPPQAPAMRPAPAAPQPSAVKPPAAPFAPQPPAAKTNVPTPPVPFRNPNPFAST
ncbi:MAG TPA: hypothetical protein VKV04_23330, partial [Verrucomicrobiae bacterium]|nr:hypothetical protein [Verrucomicrobiae bacterium]